MPPPCTGLPRKREDSRARPSRDPTRRRAQRAGSPFCSPPRWPLQKDKVLHSYLCWQSQTHTSRLRSSLPPEPEEQTTRQTGPKPCGCAVVHYDFRFLLRPADPNAFIHRQSSRSHSARGPIFLPERHSPSLALTMAPPSPPPSPNLLITHSNMESSDSKSGC